MRQRRRTGRAAEFRIGHEMMDDWIAIVPFDSIPRADAAWRAWLARNDISALKEEDITIDTGRGEHDGCIGSVRRYRVRSQKISVVVPKATGGLSR